MYIYLYIYIYILYTLYIYIYIYTHTYVYIYTLYTYTIYIYIYIYRNPTSYYGKSYYVNRLLCVGFTLEIVDPKNHRVAERATHLGQTIPMLSTCPATA